MDIRLLSLITIFLIMNSSALAAGALSYSGRLVNTNGSPIVGPVNLKFELANSADPTTILCSEQISNVSLSHGVFHVQLNLNCGGASLAQVLSAISDSDSAIIRVTNMSAGKLYSFQAISPVPQANTAEVAKQLFQMGANNNEVLTWTGTKWEPRAVSGASGGTVTEVVAGSGLSGGTITGSGTIAIANAGVTDAHLAGSIARTKLVNGTANYVIVNNASGIMSEVAQLPITHGGTGAGNAVNARANLGLGSAATANVGYSSGNVLPADNIPVCLPSFKLQFTGVGPTYWSCVNDNDSLDGTKLPLAGGTMAGQIDMGSNRIVNVGAPTGANDVATKAYVDSQNGGSSPWTTSGTDIHNNNSGNVGIGISSPDLPLHISTGAAIDRFGGMSPHLVLRGAGGTLAAPSATTNAAGIGMVSGNNFDGSTWVSAASMNFFASEAATSSNRGAGISFATTLNGSNSAVTRMILDNAGNLSIGKTTAVEKLDIAGNVAIEGKVRLKSTNTNYVELKAPNALSATLIFNLPGVAGTSGQALITDGAGNLSWATVATGASAVGGDLTGTVSNAQIASGAIVDADVSASAAIAQTKISGLATSLSGKEPIIPAGTTTQYWRGDKSWQTLNGAVVANTAAGNIAATNVQAALNELDSEKQSLIPTGTTAQYYRGDKTWRSLQTDVQSVVLNNYVVGTNSVLANTDSIQGAFGKLQAQLNVLSTSNAGKEPAITAGTIAQYRRGDKSWQTLNTSVVPESGNLYFTDARARATPLTGYATGANTVLAATDSILGAFGKIQAQISANLTAFNNTAQWSKNGTSAYYSAGNVGINTTAPSQRLHVTGNIRVDNGTSATIYNSGGMRFSGVDGAGTHTNYVFRPGWGSAANTLATIYLQNANTSGGFNNCVVLSSFGPSYLNCGGLGIGTTNPQAQLDVVGRVRASHAGMPAVELYNTSAPANQRWVELYSGTDGIVALRTMNDAYSAGATIFHSHRNPGTHTIDYTVFDGDFGLGMAPSYRFHSNGTVAGVGAYVNASDIRLKKNITPMSDAEDKILKLTGVYFDWRQKEFPDMNFEQDHDVGVIAQEVEKVFPEAVKKDKKGYRSVAYSKLVAPLIEVSKSNIGKIRDLEKSNREKDQKIKELEMRLSRLEKLLGESK